MEKIDLLKIKLNLLLKKRNNIVTYNLSGSGWQDSYSSFERFSLERKNRKAEKKYQKYDKEIVGIVKELINNSFTIDEILREFPDISKVLSDNELWPL